MFSPTPQEAPAETATMRRRIVIGLPRSASDSERRFPLTPEGVRLLVERGFAVVMESGAAAPIHFTDAAYLRVGGRIVPRLETLQADMVIHLAPLAVADIKKMRRGALLLSLANFGRKDAADVVRQLLDRRIINIALDLVRDPDGHRPFADILAEVAGRAAVALAAGMMAQGDTGKGVLLGGVAGVVPCEVMLLGSDLAAQSAARSAAGLGATVRMFDNDVYRLRQAVRMLPGSLIASSIHPHALENGLRSADVIIVASSSSPVRVDADAVGMLKRGVLIFDLTDQPGAVFPSLPLIDLAVPTPADVSALKTETTEPRRQVYCNVGNVTARTAAMGLSDTLLTLLDEIADCEGTASAIQLTPGLQQGTLTFLGKAVNQRVATLAGVRCTDIRLLLSLC